METQVGDLRGESLRGDIVFRDVRFAYAKEKSRDVLRGVDFQVDGGAALGT